LSAWDHFSEEPVIFMTRSDYIQVEEVKHQVGFDLRS
jgi:hypothetical protein